MGAPSGEPRRRADGEETQAMPPDGRRRRGGRGPEGPGGRGPGGRGPRDPRDFDDDDDDGKPRRTGWKRFIPSWKILVAGFTILVAGVFGMIAVAYANTPVPTGKQADATAEGSVFYYRDGKTAIGRIGQSRVNIDDIKKIPMHVQDAVIAAENRSFREDSGISFSGLMRSVYMTVTGEQVQGASTITQQMARNYYDGLSREVSAQRKIKEIFVAIKLNKEKSKDEILLQYLNTVPFGRGANGIEAAARAFFKKHVWELDEGQAAYLAGRIQSPSRFDVEEKKKNFALTRERFAYAIDGMAKLDPAKYGGLPAKYGVQVVDGLPKLVDTKKFPKLAKDDDKNVYGGLKGYMIVQAMEELKDRGISPDMVRSNGYKIITTFDKRLMLAAKKTVKDVTKANGMSKEYHAGLAAVDPRNGRVLAFYGGDDYVTDNWNEAFDSRKQAASAFKPYVLAAWLDAGYSLGSLVPGNVTKPEKLPGTTPIKNSHNVGQAIDLIKATAQSVNTAFASMGYTLDEKSGTIGQLAAVKQIAIDAGLSKYWMDKDVEDHKYLFTIGSALVTPVEQAAGYSIFANAGKHVDYHVVKEVKQGNLVVMPEQATVKQVISAEAAADATVAMEEVLKSGTARGKGIGRPAAGKTGTNNDEKEAWFVGYTPQLVTAVGMYREQCYTKSGKLVPLKGLTCPLGKEPKYGENNPYSTAKEVSLGFEGAGPPTSIWRAFMLEAMKDEKAEQFPAKSGMGQPENIVPSPSPSPSATPEGEEFPPDGGFPPDDTTDCDPMDLSCNGTGDLDPGGDSGGEEDPWGDGGDGFGQGPAVAPAPSPGPSGRRTTSSTGM
ncbi:transglycosylase domain-containing protein [Microtetraspora niveoalba]|uniref:transglycosylase domain-containing protein n=1 Tax=Microtetraspora niveoalba TaxID=46175 RepID=UPI00082D87AD|nr:transglycosylase domain-containing protein [Microtetraspora niveoalba]